MKKEIYDSERRIILLCILTILLIASASYITIYLTEPALQEVILAAPKHNKVNATEETGRYLEFADYGVQMPLLVGMEDMSVENISQKNGDSPQQSYFGFKSAELENLVNQSAQKADNQSCVDKNNLVFGYISKFKGYPDGNDLPMRDGTYVLGDSYLGYATPQDSCTSDKKIQDFISAKLKLIQEAFTKMQSTGREDLNLVQQGSISGSYAYPGKKIPSEIKMCAELVDKSKSYCQTFQFSDPKYKFGIGFEITVPVGDYHVYSTIAENPRSQSAAKAFYDKAVECGLTPNCTDKTPVVVKVTQGSRLKNVDPIDWY